MINRCPTRPPTPGLPTPPRPRNWFLLLLYRLRPQWFMPRRICSWCEATIARPGFFSRHKTSHGICKRCSEESWRQIQLARRVASAAILFFAAILATSCCDEPERPAVYRPQMHRAVLVSLDAQEPSLEVRP